MNRNPDLIVEGGGLGRLVVAWRALQAGRSVLLVKRPEAGPLDPALLPGFGAINLRALSLALAGAEPGFLAGLKLTPQSLIQVIAPDIRMHWWTDSRRLDKEIDRVTRRQPLRQSIDALVRHAVRHEDRMFEAGRMAPRGLFRSRFGRWVTFPAPKAAKRELEKSGFERFWDLTAAALSGGFDPEPAAAIIHATVADSDHWITGAQAQALVGKLEEVLKNGGAEFVNGTISRFVAEPKSVKVTVGGKDELGSGALVLGLSEPAGFPENRSLKEAVTYCVSFVFRAPAGALEPALGPRAVWYRSHEGESGPRVLWIGREALSEKEERVVVSVHRVPGHNDGPLDKHLALPVLAYLAELSPGFDRLATIDSIVSDPRTAWVPPELPGVEKPRLMKTVFRLDGALAGSFGSTVELAQARDLSRWFEAPRPRTDSRRNY